MADGQGKYMAKFLYFVDKLCRESAFHYELADIDDAEQLLYAKPDNYVHAYVYTDMGKLVR